MVNRSLLEVKRAVRRVLRSQQREWGQVRIMTGVQESDERGSADDRGARTELNIGNG